MKRLYELEGQIIVKAEAEEHVYGLILEMRNGRTIRLSPKPMGSDRISLGGELLWDIEMFEGEK